MNKDDFFQPYRHLKTHTYRLLSPTGKILVQTRMHEDEERDWLQTIMAEQGIAEVERIAGDTIDFIVVAV